MAYHKVYLTFHISQSGFWYRVAGSIFFKVFENNFSICSSKEEDVCFLKSVICHPPGLSFFFF